MADLELIATKLRELDVFCAGPTAGDIYNWVSCRKSHADGVALGAILDRNVLKDVISLASSAEKGFRDPIEERARSGAAVMAYLLCCNILVDPGLAVHEGTTNAEEELELFRRADEGDAAMFAEVALGRAKRLNARCLATLERSRVQDTVWGDVPGKSEHRVAVLKIATLELSSLSHRERMEHFITWTFDNYIFLPAAMNLAIHQFRPQRSNPVLRHTASADRARALRAVDNAVWDLTIGSNWAERVTRQLHEKKFWILCSRDDGLKALAKTLHFSRDVGQTRESALGRLFADAWGASHGGRLAARTLQLMLAHRDDRRWSNQPGFAQRIIQMTAELEAHFLDWRPVDFVARG